MVAVNMPWDITAFYSRAFMFSFKLLGNLAIRFTKFTEYWHEMSYERMSQRRPKNTSIERRI
jgi:hypothetical protein